MEPVPSVEEPTKSAAETEQQAEQAPQQSIEASTEQPAQVVWTDIPAGNCEAALTPPCRAPFEFGAKSKYSWPADATFEEVRKDDQYMASALDVKNKGRFQVGMLVQDELAQPPREAGLVGLVAHTHGHKVDFWTAPEQSTINVVSGAHVSLIPHDPIKFLALVSDHTASLVKAKIDHLKVRSPYPHRDTVDAE